MSHALSSPAVASLMAASTSKVWLHLLSLSHSTWANPYRLVDDLADITSRGNVYTAYGFQLSIPPEVADELPRVELIVDNTAQLLIAAIEALQTPPTVTLELVLADTPDTVERGPWTFSVRQMAYDVSSIRTELTYEPLSAEPFPALRFTPTKFAGLFNAVDR